ncbi:MAG: septum formation family protein [Actinomyces urogenitalis]|uniref:septum formation family protein n=1 Tax=Actinomyces urogenitalis TaxID=103621 RepID=UPI002A7ED95B|nr:septum formation family protein [Actinomyces urogenitalis]MDY3678551.1 septum formation family protein [Actinomyces urogenitalis]
MSDRRTIVRGSSLLLLALTWGLTACSGGTPAPTTSASPAEPPVASSATASSQSPTPPSLSQLREGQQEAYREYLAAEPGSCWTLREDAAGSWRVTCDQPHRLEVVAAWDEVPTGPYDEQTQERLDQECTQRQGTVSPRDDATNVVGTARTITLEAPQWDEAARTGTSVHVACAWYYVSDQTGFAPS